jgi:hypothetical protein
MRIRRPVNTIGAWPLLNLNALGVRHLRDVTGLCGALVDAAVVEGRVLDDQTTHRRRTAKLERFDR